MYVQENLVWYGTVGLSSPQITAQLFIVNINYTCCQSNLHHIDRNCLAIVVN